MVGVASMIGILFNSGFTFNEQYSSYFQSTSQNPNLCIAVDLGSVLCKFWVIQLEQKITLIMFIFNNKEYG